MINKIMIGACAGLALMSNAANAEIVTINVSATVNYVDDIANVLGNQVAVGDVITGSYSYDTTTIDSDPSPEFGKYDFAPGAGSMSFTVNGLTLASNPAAPIGAYSAEVVNYAGGDGFHVRSFENNLLPSGGKVMDLSFNLYDPTGSAHPTDQLPTNAPTLSAYQYRDLLASGNSADGLNFFYMGAEITSVSVESGTPDGSYQVAAIVRDVYDPFNLLQGQVNIGDNLTGGYAVDLLAADTDPTPEHAYYFNPMDPAYGFDVNINNLNFKSDSLAMASEVHIQDSFSDHYHSVARSGSVTGTSLSIDEIAIYMDDPSGLALSSTAQPAAGLNVSAFQIKDLLIVGSDGTGQYFHIITELVSINANLAPSVVISPATDSSFVLYQRFDMAVILPAQTAALPMAIRGNLNGVPEPYFSSSLCGPGPVTMSNQQVFICADTNQVLRPGTNQIDLLIDMDDGSVLTGQVIWNRLD